MIKKVIIIWGIMLMINIFMACSEEECGDDWEYYFYRIENIKICCVKEQRYDEFWNRYYVKTDTIKGNKILFDTDIDMDFKQIVSNDKRNENYYASVLAETCMDHTAILLNEIVNVSVYTNKPIITWYDGKKDTIPAFTNLANEEFEPHIDFGGVFQMGIEFRLVNIPADWYKFYFEWKTVEDEVFTDSIDVYIDGIN